MKHAMGGNEAGHHPLAGGKIRRSMIAKEAVLIRCQLQVGHAQLLSAML